MSISPTDIRAPSCGSRTTMHCDDELPASPKPVGHSGVVVLILTQHMARSGSHRGRYDARLGSELIVTSRQPLLDGARALLERGYHPSTTLTIRHKNSAQASFVPRPIGELAGWTIEASDRDGLRRRRWRPPMIARAQDKDPGAAIPLLGGPRDAPL